LLAKSSVLPYKSGAPGVNPSIYMELGCYTFGVSSASAERAINIHADFAPAIHNFFHRLFGFSGRNEKGEEELM
jgi:hypothetical protein